MTNLENNMEVEYKFWAGFVSKKTFHDLVNKMRGIFIEPIYVCSCDDYYTRNDGVFLRHRKGSNETELTLKSKRGGNVIRKEVNLNLTGNDDSSVVEFLNLSGYSKSFSVFKEAWIWNFTDCDISYYTLSDGRSIIEVEATQYTTLDEGVAIINDYIERLGLLSEYNLQRESRSLFEIFTDEKNVEEPKPIIDYWGLTNKQIENEEV